MEPSEALKEAANRLGWGCKEIARAGNITYPHAWRLLKGRQKPGFETDQNLRRNIPGYATFVDEPREPREADSLPQ